ncbi:MAG: DMT family transporter [Acidobacteria bacterium]|nr:DMT family transporter [Acidobacteriota bacterium]
MTALLVLMVVIWGVNYSVLKRAFLEIPPPVFATLRLAIASSVYLAMIALARRRTPGGATTGLAAIFYTPHKVTAQDRRDLVWLGFSGHCLYQLFFVGGLARTTASNGALIFGTTPAVVALASAIMGHERVGLVHWLGAALSAVGIYFVVGHGASLGSSTLAGDLMIGAGVVCWAAYTIGGIRLMARHSPLFVTGVSMAIGTVPYALISLPDFADVQWGALSGAVWGALLFASLGAFCFCYLVWYAGVQRLGPSYTAMYSNAIPLVAMLVAAVWLGEPLTVLKIVGAALVVGGVVLTRLQRS